MKWLLIGYMFLYIHRPFEIWPVLATVRLELVYISFASLVWLIWPGKKYKHNRLTLFFLLFAFFVLVCFLANPISPDAQLTVENFFKLYVFYFLLITAINSENDLRLFVKAFVVIMAIYMLHSLWEFRAGRHTYRMGIPRLIGVNSALGNPNSFGASIVYALPFVIPLWTAARSRRGRLAILGYVGLSFLCIFLTGSRSSLAGLLLWVAVVSVYSRNRARLVLGSVVAIPLMFLAMPDYLQGRFETIINPDAGPRSARTSGEGRIEGLERGVGLLANYPLTGCGPGRWKDATGLEVESHNLYGQLMGEMGLLGIVGFSLLLFGYRTNIRKITALYRPPGGRPRDFVYYLTRAVALALFLLLFEGNFGHNLFRYNWLWNGAFLVCALHCVNKPSSP